MGRQREARSLKTATVVLRALRLLGAHPRGLTAGELGAELGKSPATARYMINTLCEAGFAIRDSGGRCRISERPPWGPWSAGTLDASTGPPATVGLGDPDPGPVLAEAVTDLYRRTRQRSYLVRQVTTSEATVADVRGHQGLARLPGLSAQVPPGSAHALAMTKVLLAVSPTYLDAVASGPLTPLTGRTLICLADLRRDLEQTRVRGHARDEQEYADGFCTIAAPVTSPSGGTTVALGISTSARRFAADADEMAGAVVEVAHAAERQWEAALREAAPQEERVSGPLP